MSVHKITVEYFVEGEDHEDALTYARSRLDREWILANDARVKDIDIRSSQTDHVVNMTISNNIHAEVEEYSLTVEEENKQTDAWMAKWVEELERIYDEKTAGDYTFRGLLGTAYNELYDILRPIGPE